MLLSNIRPNDVHQMDAEYKNSPGKQGLGRGLGSGISPWVIIKSDVFVSCNRPQGCSLMAGFSVGPGIEMGPLCHGVALGIPSPPLGIGFHKGVCARDIAFSSPSAAATIVLGTSAITEFVELVRK